MSLMNIAWVLTVAMVILKIIGVGFMATVSWWGVFAPIPLVILVGVVMALTSLAVFSK